MIYEAVICNEYSSTLNCTLTDSATGCNSKASKEGLMPSRRLLEIYDDSWYITLCQFVEQWLT